MLHVNKDGRVHASAGINLNDYYTLIAKHDPEFNFLSGNNVEVGLAGYTLGGG